MRLFTLPSIKYKNHSGHHGSHLGGGSTGIGENCGALGGGPLGGEVDGGRGPVLVLALPAHQPVLPALQFQHSSHWQEFQVH